MGINDRDYYRDEEPGYLGSYRDHANACTWLIGICVVTFILQLITRENAAGIFLPGAFTQSLWLDVALIGKWQVWRLVSYAFLHSTDGVWHILFNMLALWFFGRQVEQRVGTREFVALYLCAAIFSALAYVLTSSAGLHRPNPVIGASGAVAAVMMLSAIYNPRQVVFLFLVIPVSIWVIVVMMIVMDGFTLLAQVPSQVASAAHLGGLLFGYLYYRWSMRLTDLVRFHFHFRVVRSRPRLKLFSPESEQTPVSTRQADQYQAARVDAILEKVGRVGVKGLTEEERRTLIQASEHIRRRDK